MGNAAGGAEAVPKLALTLAASALGVEAGQVAVEAFLAAQAIVPRARARVALVLEEAVMNVALHGHDGPGSHSVGLALRVLSDGIELSLEDDGRPFDPRGAEPPPRPQSLAEARPGGLGVHLMRSFSRRLHYERREGRNRLELLLERQ
jgi:anti-sigma regulatory factor (Ser/Thr protein kinase)